ncbi:MarR family transcriptional regulator [Flammeovirga sp. MY04]|uniref:MarR family winged helix-turn-helix transcriptional regulator n=1 Tax=Flammeovirga sp. MY04 TaxID=1191459 RepID=UPI0008061F04|nr:MarR family transcriptional regulator [Flammeovirga sp. MY04]ANQ49401.1 MarR family transcriptional regulator [Flammeovirga sp. MY04]
MNTKSYYKAIHEIIKTGHWITDAVGQVLKEDKITEPQFNVLRILKGQKGSPITVQEIQERMVQRSSNVTRIIDKLLDKGLVKREECPTNRRKMDITITPFGLEELERFDQKVIEFHVPYTQNLTAEEAETLEKLIKKLKGE